MNENENVMDLLNELSVNQENVLNEIKNIKEIYNSDYDKRFKQTKIANKIFELLEKAIRSRNIKGGRDESLKNKLKEANEKLSNKIEELLKKLKENGENVPSDPVDVMKQCLEEEGYSVYKANEVVALTLDELPPKLKDEIRSENLRTGKKVNYEKKKEIVMNALKKACEN